MYNLRCLEVASLLYALLTSSGLAEPAGQKPLMMTLPQRQLSTEQTVSAAQEFGVGFDFSTSGATAAISFADGSSVGVISISGNRAYTDMMRRLSLIESRHPHPPYTKADGFGYNDIPRQKWRQFRKSLGFAASRDSAIIAEMAIGLKKAVEAYLHQPINNVTVTAPPLSALYEEDLIDGIEHINLTFSNYAPKLSVIPYWTSALAGYHHALCPDYTDSTACITYSCEPMKRYDNLESTLYVHFTTEALLSYWVINHPTLYWTLHLLGPPFASNFSLGSNSEPADDSSSYWEQVRDWIRKPIRDYCGFLMYPITKVVASGDGVYKTRFKDTLRSAVRYSCGGYEPLDPMIVDDDPHFVNAKGAAELGKRAFYLNPDNEGLPMYASSLPIYCPWRQY